MTDLIAVNQEKKSVNARDLWKYLESKQDFSTWIKNRVEKWGFKENIDYTLIHKKMEQVSGAKHAIEFVSKDIVKTQTFVTPTGMVYIKNKIGV